MIKVRQKNPLLEARQLNVDNPEEISEWLQTRHGCEVEMLWEPRDSSDQSPRPQLKIQSNKGPKFRIRVGDWVVAGRGRWPEPYSDEVFRSEFEVEPDESNPLGNFPGATEE